MMLKPLRLTKRGIKTPMSAKNSELNDSRWRWRSWPGRTRAGREGMGGTAAARVAPRLTRIGGAALPWRCFFWLQRFLLVCARRTAAVGRGAGSCGDGRWYKEGCDMSETATEDKYGDRVSAAEACVGPAPDKLREEQKAHNEYLAKPSGNLMSAASGVLGAAQAPWIKPSLERCVRGEFEAGPNAGGPWNLGGACPDSLSAPLFAEERGGSAFRQAMPQLGATKPADDEIAGFGSRPPLGLKPRRNSEDERLAEVLDAMARYVRAGKAVPGEWREELEELLARRGSRFSKLRPWEICPEQAKPCVPQSEEECN